MPVHTTHFTFGGLGLALESPRPLPITPDYAPFVVPDTRVTVRIQLQEVQHLPPIHGVPVYQHPAQWNRVLYQHDGTHARVFWDEAGQPLAQVTVNPERTLATLCYLPHAAGRLRDSNSVFRQLPLEELLLWHDRILLHAAVVATPFGGILFTGPSGIGKSTQAELWCRYQNARILNGDRALLVQEKGQWCAYGSPYAGSSGIYTNASTPIAALVALDQGEQTTLTTLYGGAAFARVFSQCAQNTWNPAYTRRLCSLTEAILAELPLYHLTCTPDASAVEVLKLALSPEIEAMPHQPNL